MCVCIMITCAGVCGCECMCGLCNMYLYTVIPAGPYSKWGGGGVTLLGMKCKNKFMNSVTVTT